MLLVLSSILLLSIICICLGYLVLSQMRLVVANDLAANVYGSYWIGYSLLMLGATVGACFGPVGPVGVPLLLAVLAATLCAKSVRRLVADCLATLRAGNVVAAILLIAPLCLLAVYWGTGEDGRMRGLTDTGFYHDQIIRWYSQYGAVPGMALQYYPLGFHSGPFALAALLDSGSLLGRSGSIVNLSAEVTSLWFGAVLLFRSKLAPSVQNLFLPIYLLLLLPAVDVEPTLVTDNADIPLYLYIGAAFWLTCMWREKGLARHASWAVLLLGAAAMNVKLTGILLLPILFVISIWFVGPSIRVLLTRGAFCLLLIAPYLVVQTITSGHPLYPAVTLPLPVDWAVPKGLVAAVRDSVNNYPIFGVDPPVPLTFWEYTGRALIGAHKPYLLGLLLLLLFSIVLAWRDRDKSFPMIFAASLAAVGLAGVIPRPEFRYAFGFLVALPALVLAKRRDWFLGVFAATLAFLYPNGFTGNRLDNLRIVVYLGVVLVFGWASLRGLRLPSRALIGLLILGQFMRPLSTAARETSGFLHHPSWLVRPQPPILRPNRIRWAVLGNVAYKQPMNQWNCWTEIPCSPPPPVLSKMLAFSPEVSQLSTLRYRCGVGKLSCGFSLKTTR